MAIGFINTGNFKDQLAARGGNSMQPMASPVAAPKAAMQPSVGAYGQQQMVPPVPSSPSQFNMAQVVQAVRNHTYEGNQDSTAELNKRRSELLNGPDKQNNFNQYIRGMSMRGASGGNYNQGYSKAPVTAPSDPVPVPPPAYKPQSYRLPVGYTNGKANATGYPAGFIPMGV